MRQKSCAQLQDETKKMSSYIKDQGYNVIEITECQWETEKKENIDLRQFLKTIRPTHYDQKRMTQREILHFIAEGSMFGLVECDLHVPPALKEVFEEMTPIFKNAYIGKNDIGDHMRDYAEREGLMKTPRKSLIGSMFGEEILLATPLLQWYLSHGIEVQHIYQVIQYRPRDCFKTLGKQLVMPDG